MVGEKLRNFKRKILINVIYFLFNIKKNSKYLLLILIYFQFIFATILFGVGSLFGFWWHLFVLLVFFLIFICLANSAIRYFRYYNKNYIRLWIDQKNFKSINPLTALKDKPANINYNKNFWYFHKLNINKNLKNINFPIPLISFNKDDPLKVRYLFLLFLLLAIYWSLQNNMFYKNIYEFTKFEQNKKSLGFFELKAWIKPPEYTNLKQKVIDVSNIVDSGKVDLVAPVNSELNLFIRTSNNNFLIKDHNRLLKMQENEKNNYEVSTLIKKKKSILVQVNKKDYISFNLSILKDNLPQIELLSQPYIANEVALSFISKASDDYGIREVKVFIKKPNEYEHFEEKHLSYILFSNPNYREQNKLTENYFYKYLADEVWAGSDTLLEIVAVDFAKQNNYISKLIKMPQKNFQTDLAIKLLKIRESIAKKQISLDSAKKELIKFFENNVNQLNDKNFRKYSLEIMNTLNSEKPFIFSISNKLFKDLYELAEVIEEGNLYLAKKNMEKIEQNLFDSIKQKDSDKVSANSKKLKDNIESLLNLENKNKKDNSYIKKQNQTIKEEIEKLSQQIEDLLKAGSQNGLEEKIQQLKQLSEGIKNPNRNKKAEENYQKKRDFINKLSELLNEQEKVMEETFNRAADRGKFEQSSEGSGGKSPKEKQEDLRNTLGNVIREIGASENEIPQELGRADRAMRQASRDLENGRPDEASTAQGKALEMIQRSINKINSDEFISNKPQIAKEGKEIFKSDQREYLSENQNLEYQGASAGGKLNMPNESEIKSSSKIANELYKRYSQEDRSLNDKKHIKNLLDWY